ncbi:MAG: hypothetical protein HY834_06720 [Devosia nanyangense]|uniref:Phenylacetate--CoA ligase family protein n=1 Tax=Devosia nanyangense TaxID=1228055 RepID=A0A933NXP2_9HYPH|nr:hypothetical protein [Devosia nanyangense]
MPEAYGLQRQFFEMLLDSQWWSTEALRDYQRSQLSQLLRHARANVPFYERRLDALFRANGDIDWDKWGEVPIVKRQDMIDHRQAMQARELPNGHGPTAVFKTSGSTGLAIEITSTAIAAVADRGFRWRVHKWHDLDWSKTLISRLGYASHSEWFGGAEALGIWGPTWDSSAKQGAAWMMDRERPNEDVFGVLRRHHCTYLNSGALSSHVMARDSVRLGVELRIEAILTQGNLVRQADRDICRQVFGARLIEHYSSKEGGQLAHGCPLGKLHLNVEGSLLEVLDHEGNPCHPGQTGRVVITPVFQTAQPLIRYEQGDLATVGSPCACGRTAPTLDGVIGRSISLFVHPTGRAKVLSILPDDTPETLQSVHLQVAQVGPNAYELRYQPIDWTRFGDENTVADHLRDLLWDDIEIRFVRRRDLALARADKLIEFVNEWSGPVAN